MILYAPSIGYREGIIQFQKAYMESELVKNLRHKYLLSLHIALEKYKYFSQFVVASTPSKCTLQQKKNIPC